jgi:methyltransferase-like protein 6
LFVHYHLCETSQISQMLRRYLLLEFPCLTVSQPPQQFMEIGCGCGSSLLPVLKANPTCTVTGTDLSPTAVDMFKRAAAKAGIASHRFTGYAADSTQADAVGGAEPNSQGELWA